MYHQHRKICIISFLKNIFKKLYHHFIISIINENAFLTQKKYAFNIFLLEFTKYFRIYKKIRHDFYPQGNYTLDEKRNHIH